MPAIVEITTVTARRIKSLADSLLGLLVMIGSWLWWLCRRNGLDFYWLIKQILGDAQEGMTCLVCVSPYCSATNFSLFDGAVIFLGTSAVHLFLADYDESPTSFASHAGAFPLLVCLSDA